MRRADDARLLGEVTTRLAGREDIAIDDAAQVRIGRLMPSLKERAHDLAALADGAAFAARTRPIPLEPKARALLTARALDDLAALLPVLADVAVVPEALHAALVAFAAGRGWGGAATRRAGSARSRSGPRSRAATRARRSTR